ncbi:MAG: Ig-like domain-containing protein [Flavobacteriaceae bacterium]
MKKKFILLFIAIGLLFTNCAKRGTITGGDKDTLAPVLKISLPKNYTTNFNDKVIKLTFDEYVKLKDINKQLIISPPLEKTPRILPLNAAKTVSVEFLEDLQPNTTYNLNFGQSIQDFNEGNPYKDFKYVFSTGAFIDSLQIEGSVKDALSKQKDKDLSIMLYEVNEKYTDSAVFKQNPRYITNSADTSGVFKIENIKAGKYVLIGLKDDNKNHRFDPKSEKIGFLNAPINLPSTETFEIKLFQEILSFKAYKPVQNSAASAYLGYEGNPKELQVELKRNKEVYPHKISKVADKDSIILWFKPVKLQKSEVDSLDVVVSNQKYKQNFTFKIRNQKADSLKISPVQSKFLGLNESISLKINIPISKIDESKISITAKDTTQKIPFKLIYDEMNLNIHLDFKKEPLTKYSLKMAPGGLLDFFDHLNKKPILYEFETKNISDYGNLRLDVENVKQYPIIVELTDKNGIVQYSMIHEKPGTINFELIKPDLYTLRIICDNNKNGIWDTGNYLQKLQPEEVIYFPKNIDIRANWDVQQTFILKK